MEDTSVKHCKVRFRYAGIGKNFSSVLSCNEHTAKRFQNSSKAVLLKQKTAPTNGDSNIYPKGIHDRNAYNVDSVARMSSVRWDADSTYKHNSCMS